MYRVTSGSTKHLSDVESFISMLDTLSDYPDPKVRSFFDPDSDLIITRAPGRLDVMGGIADYSGSLVLQLPIAEAALVALQKTPDRTIRILSLPAYGEDEILDFEIPLAAIEDGNHAIGYEAARSYFRHQPWAAYIAGAFLVLMRERGIVFPNGTRIMIRSSVPQGKGVSSSAAIEVATMQAIAAAFDIVIDPIDLALLCQKVENLIVGAPCGVMDQMTSVCGEAGRLLRLRCQPATPEQTLSVPDSLRFVGIDSGIRHSVSGSDYTSVRTGAFMGYRIIAELASLHVTQSATDTVEIDDPIWHGYLANLTPSEFEQRFSASLPEIMAGAGFLTQYDGITDSVTTVDDMRTYAVLAPTAHPVFENFRVEAFAELLSGSLSAASRRVLGELMYQSHASYSKCGLGSTGTDLLVRLARESGPTRGIYGAKITGGGSGGTVAVMCDAAAIDVVEEIADKYESQTGYRPYIFNGTSMGATQFRHLRLEPVR